MESQQIVDYIAKEIKNGHNEATLRKHLQAYGWTASALDDAFMRYHNSAPAAKPRPVVKRGGRKQKSREKAKAFATLVVLGFVAAGVLHLLHRSGTPHAAAAPPRLTYAQQQTLDVTIIGGAIGQYTQANDGVLPTRLTIGTSPNSLVMCNATCDPMTSQISPLSVYRAANVKLMPYVSGLTAPDDQTVYLVPGAACRSKNALGDATVTPRAMVILYAASEGNAITQRCLKL